MRSNRLCRLILCLVILSAVVIFPVFLLAGENGEEIEHEVGFYHTVQKGDTLWDLSRHYFDSAWQWPDLWHENAKIPNPHWIYPGQRIRLLRQSGTEGSDVGRTSDPSSPMKKRPYYYYSQIEGIGFIRKEPINPCGTIFKVKEDKRMISEGDLVYLKESGNTPLAPGERFTVYRTLDPLMDTQTDTPIGIQHYITGVVEITKKEPRFAVARIVKSFRSIKVDDLLMPYKRRAPRIPLLDSQPACDGKILLSEEHEEIFADNTVAFIDKGDKDGIIPGQFYSIYYQEEQQLDPESEARVFLTPVDFGKLLVLHTEATTATVLITNAAKDVNPGSKICTPLEE